MAEYFQTLDSLIALQKRVMALATQQAQEQAARTGTLMLVLAFVVLVLGVGTTWLITRSITRALGGEPAYASHIAAEIAAGNLAVTIQTAAGDGHSLLAQMRAMRDALAQVVASVRGSSEAVASASGQIAQGNHDLSARTESQASALEETAASMEQLSSTVRHNADNAQQANALAQSASQVATQGGAVVAQVVDTMRGISSASQRIADIIGVIDGIAFQTNILALNAAVEAARAGEQGRGFAVVASEVRQLAQRSAEAAKEIKLLIHDSSAQVQQGTQLVDNAGSTMDEVVASIRRVTDIMGEISAASREQSAGVAQVGEAVTQMDQATQQNAALVEEMAAAAGSLSQQARDLVQAVAVFHLTGTAPHAAQHGRAQGSAAGTRAPQGCHASAAPLGGPAYLALPD
ncbi:methyl-accepting chemotaxis protein [Acidovorax sp. HDW3]|nr:methyl-accepting chemotaxis protein [Acidovorax sp. HDW3]